MADTRISDLASLYAAVYEDTILAARANSPLSAIVGVYTDQNGVADRTFSQRAKLSAAAVAENADLAPSTFSKSSTAALTPGEVGVQGVLTDRVMRTDPMAAAALALDMGGAMAEKIDTDLATSFANFTGVAGGLGSATTCVSLTFQTIAAAKVRLAQAGIRGDLFLAVHPYSWFDLANSVSLEASIKNTPEVIREELVRNYYLGTVFQNVHIIESPHNVLANDTQGTPVQYATNALFPSMAMALDWRDPAHMEPFRSPKGRKTEFNVVGDYAAGVAYPARGVKIYSKAVVPS